MEDLKKQMEEQKREIEREMEEMREKMDRMKSAPAAAGGKSMEPKKPGQSTL